MKRILCLLFLILPTLFFGDFSFKDKFVHAEKGDYFVTKQNKVFSILIVHSLQNQTLILEEISAPAHKINKRKINWKKWVEDRAPGHSSWIMYEIDLQHGKLLECYSFSQNAFLTYSSLDTFLPTLLKLPLSPIPKHSQKKIGPPPTEGPDYRKLWKPPLYFSGQKQKNTEFTSYTSHWPNDGTELASKKIELFFDEKRPSFPFPYWIEIADSHLTFKIHTIDSGKNLLSPYQQMPKRAPEFIGTLKPHDDCMRLKIKSSHQKLELYALDLSTTPRLSHALKFNQIYDSKENIYALDISQNTLENILIPGHEYLFIACPETHPSLYTELEHPITWKVVNKH